jgi:Uma2 family endonuclease
MKETPDPRFPDRAPVISSKRNLPMAVAAVETHRWNRDEYERMAAQGFFAPDARVELVDGIVYDMTPQGSFHSAGVCACQKILDRIFSDGHDVRVQMPLAIGECSEPEPDLAVVSGSYQDYAFSQPRTAVLVVEVADKSLAHDRKRKIPDYARAGIPEVWVMNLKAAVLGVYRDPRDGVYQTRLKVRIGDKVSPLAEPAAEIAVAELFFWKRPAGHE